jgi:hypothetical protein
MPSNHASSQFKLSGNMGKTGKLYYRKPQLLEMGDLRTLTLGGSQSGYFPNIPPGGILQIDGSILMPDGSVIPPNH